MNRSDFFSAINRDCDSSIERAYRLIIARGFSVCMGNDGKVMLSYPTSSHNTENFKLESDADDLKKLLKDNGIGDIEKGEVIINENKIQELQEVLFADIPTENQGDSGWYSDDWYTFMRREVGSAVCTMMLDSFIARYVKALLACGFETMYSCDGHHMNKKAEWKMEKSIKPYALVEFRGEHYARVHAFLFQKVTKILDCHIQCVTKSSKALFYFDKANEYQLFAELNQIAEYLQNNCEMIRSIKRQIMDRVSMEIQVLRAKENAEISENRKLALLDNQLKAFNNKPLFTLLD